MSERRVPRIKAGKDCDYYRFICRYNTHVRQLADEDSPPFHNDMNFT